MRPTAADIKPGNWYSVAEPHNHHEGLLYIPSSATIQNIQVRGLPGDEHYMLNEFYGRPTWTWRSKPRVRERIEEAIDSLESDEITDLFGPVLSKIVGQIRPKTTPTHSSNYRTYGYVLLADRAKELIGDDDALIAWLERRTSRPTQ